MRQYYAKFKKTGNGRTAKIEKTEFCQIMQVFYHCEYNKLEEKDKFDNNLANFKLLS